MAGHCLAALACGAQCIYVVHRSAKVKAKTLTPVHNGKYALLDDSEKSKIEELRGEVDGLLKTWEEELPEAESTAEAEITEEQSKEDETKEFALMMKEEILGGLDKIIERQDANEIIDVGVERHITAFKDSIDELRQVEQDIVLLANLIQFEGQEDEGGELEGDESLPDAEVQDIDTAEPQTIEENDIIEGDDNFEL